VPGRPHLSPRALTPRRLNAVGLVVALVLGAGALSGCATPQLDVTPVDSPPASCAAVLAALPASVGGHQRRTVTTAARASAGAWGDPAIVLRCGVPRPASYTPTGNCLVINDIEWYVEPASGGTIFTIVGADPRIEVSVPAAYAPPSDVLVDVGTAIAATIKHPTCAG
jgi:hypothetical protein